MKRAFSICAVGVVVDMICLVFVVLKVAKDVKRIKGHMSLPMMYETVESAWNMLSVLAAAAAAGMKKTRKKRGFFNDSAAWLQRGWAWVFSGGGMGGPPTPQPSENVGGPGL